MTTDVLYDDGRVALDSRGVTLRRYYFPIGTSKHIPYRRIRRVWTREMSWWSGKGRLWGTAHPGYWLPLDGSRPQKDTLVVLDTGSPVRPAFTPDDPDRFVEIVSAHLAH
ncbi:hypothetical protein [Actinophytocola oryzae]|uniref:PH (Pleckstrin Homology) domain-containing protein n=1 Tax=Actinophytocola oryzae TaxID=502181 RepID=A0A4R7V2J9_9PSEU|nr:hypothetical protein [Actinophytocola oryzae]TDV43573.1 hypothetical protein CLV71_11535 [Actinophytocola oryzae]